MSTITVPPARTDSLKHTQELESATVRFVGDSGDGMQLAGMQFTNTSAVFGNDVSTLPDFPAEIRAPAGTLAGVSGFQVNFSNHEIFTPGDKVDALIAMNPAALKANISDLEDGGILVINTDEFTTGNLAKAHYKVDPRDDGSLNRFRVFHVPITKQTVEAVKEAGLGTKDAERCKNLYALGLIFWMYDRPLEITLKWINEKFGKKPTIALANTLAIKAGHNFGETAEMFPVRYRVNRATLAPGKYRSVTGNQATAIGLITAARLMGKPLFYGSYPITPASDILHELSMHKNFDVRTFQAEDEIAAFASIVGAAYTGAFGVTASSGPGIALKQEGIGLAVMTELPCMIVDVQRGGPSTGLPTKTEQADLWQVMLGRNGECPVPVIAAQSPADCFWTVIEAARIAVKYMTPIFVLTDGYLANGSEPWSIPNAADLPRIDVKHATDAAAYKPYLRDENGSRPWAIPGIAGLEHRVGGLEKQHETGNVNYEPSNHQLMTNLRAQKVANIVNDIPDQQLDGAATGDVLLVSWGGTYGAVRTAGQRARAQGKKVSHMHLRHLNPMPRNVGEILKKFDKILVCELNMGQLQLIIRGKFAVDAYGLHKVQGRPFMIREVTGKIDELLGLREATTESQHTYHAETAESSAG